MNYFGISHYSPPVSELGQSLRRRARFVRVEREPGAAPMLCRVRLPNSVLVEMACAPGQWDAVLQAAARLP